MGVHGIISYGAYIPRGSLLRSSIVEFTGKGSNKGSRSVASYDENTTTMGVEAARNALKGSESNPKKLGSQLLFLHIWIKRMQQISTQLFN